MIIPGMKMSIELISENGYDLGERSLARGYVSRRAKAFEVKVAQGRRKGQLYIELPHPTSTQYHFRQYLIERGSDV